MSIVGRVSINAVFHDTPTTNTIRVHAINCAEEKTTGIVARVTGTCATQKITIQHDAVPDQEYPGRTINFTTISRIVAKASATCEFTDQDSHFTMYAGPEGAASSHLEAVAKDLKVNAVTGTATYDVIIYGT